MCEMGFKVGCWVERKKDKVQASVVALSDDNVKMQCDDGQMYDVSSMAFLEGQFKLMKQPKDPVSIENYEAHLAMNSKDVSMGITKGRVLEALVALEKKHMHVHQRLRLHFKPMKEVVALKGFGKGKLVMVPCSMRVENATRFSSGMIRLVDNLALIPSMTPPREATSPKAFLLHSGWCECPMRWVNQIWSCMWLRGAHTRSLYFATTKMLKQVMHWSGTTSSLLSTQDPSLAI